MNPVDAQSRAAALQAGLQTPHSPIQPKLFPDSVHSDFGVTSNAFKSRWLLPPVRYRRAPGSHPRQEATAPGTMDPRSWATTSPAQAVTSVLV